MNRRLLLAPALLTLAFATLAFTLDAANGAAAAGRAGGKITQGALRAVDPSGKPVGECPLRRTEVRAEVSGFISRVTVTQEFENPFQDKIEAVYVFPLPQGAAVDDMTMQVGGRTVRGKIMRRAEAQAVYEAARARGHVASLLDQERPNVFTQSVANILPGQAVSVRISYVETLKYEAGTYEWSFPLVVGPRYMPAAAAAGGEASPGAQPLDAQPLDARPTATAPPAAESTPAQPSGVRPEDAARLSPPSAPEGTRAGHDVSIEVLIDAGVPLEGVASATHEVEVERPEGSRAVVRLKGGAVIPNRDFVLRYDVAGGRVEDGLLTHASGRGRYFALILQPPERVAPAEVTPKELVFVLDTSGSMQGAPLEKARETVGLALAGLNPLDTFNLITFSGDTHVLFDEPVPATPSNLAKARKFLAGRSGGGGTEMMKAIRAALAGSNASAHVRVVCFMTDGQVGNDMEIIAEVQKHPRARVFSMGFGYAPNRFLLDKMAEHGRGEVDYVADGEDGGEAARRFHERVRNPLLTDLSFDWAGLPVSDLYPKVVPDLFSARPLVVFGRYERGASGVVRIRGRAAGREFVREIPVALPEEEAGRDVLATLWARRRVDELMGRDMAGVQAGTAADPLREEITRLGLDFRLMTQFTSFVAVEERVVTDGGEPRRVDVPVETPAGPVAEHVVGVGGISQMVMVTSSTSYLNTSSSSVSSTVEARELSSLPLNERSVMSLATFAPGVVAPAPASQGRGGGLSSNGQRAGSNSFEIDGVSADLRTAPIVQSPGAPRRGVAPATSDVAGGLATLDAAQEFTVRTDQIEPQYGRTAGAQLSVITRSGTNEMRGSLFGHFGHESLDANDWFANSRGAARQPRRLAGYGGTLGGPLKRDETFFFLSYEGQRRRLPAFGITDVPTLASRLSAPASVRPFLDAFPLPNGAARADGFAEFAAGHSNPARLDAFGLRLDHRVDDRLTLNARYALAGAGSEARGAGGSTLNTLTRVSESTHSLTGSAAYTVSPEMVAELRGNYSRVAARGSRLLDSFGGASMPGGDTPAGALLAGRGGSFVFDLGGRGAALAPASESLDLQRQLNLVGALSVIAGTHALKFGADYRRLSPVVGARTPERLVYFDGVAGALTGKAARDGEFTRAGSVRPVFDNLSAYAQDEWKVSSRLTLTYGLRWELSRAPRLGGPTSAAAVTQAEDSSRLALAPAGAPLWATTFFNFAPRAGLAYQLSGDSGREVVLRAGFGLFHDTTDGWAGHAFADSHPFLGGGARFDVPFTADGAQGAAFGGAGGAAPLGVPLAAFDPRLKLPYTLRWNLSAERALGSGQSLSASYVGAAGRRLLLTRTLIEPSPDFSLVRLTNNGAESDYHSARLQFTRNLRRGLHALASYTWAKSLDDLSEDTAAHALLRGEGRGVERGPSDFDVRHTLSGLVSYKLPTPFGGGVWRALTREWTLDAVFNARSAKPLEVLYGYPVAYGFVFLRPDLRGGSPLHIIDPSAAGGRRVNPAAFVLPGALRQGTLGRNALRGFSFQRLDAALRRQFDLNERVGLQLRVEAFNLLNHPNFDDPSGTLAFSGGAPGASRAFRPDHNFGRAHSAAGARTVQLSLKLTF
jgi:Ca-activated chloride channel family protein